MCAKCQKETSPPPRAETFSVQVTDETANQSRNLLPGAIHLSHMGFQPVQKTSTNYASSAFIRGIPVQSVLRRGINMIRLSALLRRSRFHAIWILDRTTRPALAARLAGIPERIGLGLGLQKLYITNPGVDQSHFHDHPIDWLRALMAAMKVPLPTTEPALRLPPETLAAVGEKYYDRTRPWIVLGLGASRPDNDWFDAQWAEFLAGLRTPGTVFLIGGGVHLARAAGLIARGTGATTVNACELKLAEAAALLQHADLFIGPSSGPMNLAAAGGTEAFGFFGSTPLLDYSKFIHAIEPPGGQSADGMRRISPAQVLERVAPYLARQKARQ